jgi:muramidase (phage lysozyme)
VNDTPEQFPSREYPPDPWWGSQGIVTEAQSLSSASSIVISELNKTPYQREEKAFFAAISAGEVGSRGTFNTLYGGAEWTGSLAGFPNWAGVIVTDSSGEKSITHAYGAVQFEPATWNLIAGLSGKSDVTPPSQILNGIWLGYKDLRTRSGGMDLLASLKAGMLDQVGRNLYQTWPGGASTSFAARYTAALQLFPDTPAPLPIPPPPDLPPSAPELIEITIRAKVSLEDLKTILSLTGTQV